MEVAIFVPIAFFLMISFVVWQNARLRERRAQLQADVHTRLIDRFGTAPELVEFLQSEAGHQFLYGISRLPAQRAYDGVLSAVRRGIVLSFLGIGFLVSSLFPVIQEEGIIVGFLPAGIILFLFGLANLLSAWVSVRLSRSLGLNRPEAADAILAGNDD